MGGKGIGNPIRSSLNPPGPHISPQDEEPPALPPRTPEGLQVVEEPVYEAEPQQEPENDYEDVGELDPREEEEGDYEDVLEPEITPSLSYQAGEWGEWGGESSSQMWSVSGHQRWRGNLPFLPSEIVSLCFLHVMFIFLIIQDHLPRLVVQVPLL